MSQVPQTTSFIVDSGKPPIDPKYTLISKLGQGGMGEVYLAKHNESKSHVAIKYLKVGKGSKGDVLARRFERETKLYSQLSHPNIVQIREHGIVGSRPYLVLEYVSGGNLRKRMKPGQSLPLAMVRSLLKDLSCALSELETKGIIHRDLKPENILLEESGRAKVTDFGISVTVNEVGDITNTAQILGTLDYMAPEQRTRLEVDTRADQYSLAVIVYELLTGKRPLGSFKPVSQLNKNVHPALDRVLTQALQEDPDERFPTTEDACQAIFDALGRRTQPSGMIMAMLASVLLIGVLFGLGMTFGSQSKKPGKPTVANPKKTKASEQSVQTDAQGKNVPKELSPQNEDSGSNRVDKMLYFLELGDRHLQNNLDSDAEGCFTEAIRLNPKDPRGYLKRAYVHKKNKTYQNALNDLNTVLELHPNQLEALTGIGAIYVQVKDYEMALPSLNKAITRDPAFAEPYAWRGWAFYKLREYDKAIRDLDAAVSGDRNLGVAFQFRAIYHRAKKNYRQSRNDLFQAVRLMPDNRYIQATLANFLALCPDKSLRDPKRALFHAEQACELCQYNGWLELRYLAQAYSANGEIELAAKWCEKALQLAPPLSKRKVEAQLRYYRTKLKTGVSP